MMTHEDIQAVYQQGPEAVLALVEPLWLRIAQPQEQIVQLQAQVQALADRVATKSRHSSKPPSSEGFVKQTRSLRQPSQRKPGGAAGSSRRDAATGGRARSVGAARANAVRGLWDSAQ